jgi:penicillin-binding protein 1A
METILAKIFATALALSLITTAPEAVKTQFDRSRDQDEVAQLLRTGCTHMRKAFDIEDINLDDLIATAMDDSQAIANENKAFRGINFADLETAYRQFCKNEEVLIPAVNLGDVIDFYNKAASDLPDHTKLKGMKLPGASIVLDGAGQPFAEVFEENQRRVWVSLPDVPEQVQKAFLAAEDKRFYQHKGIDERGLIRAFVGNLAQSGRPQGASTITQQVVKNLLVGEDLSYERKIREMIVASRVEQTLSKAEILELYLNSVYVGRGSWGIEMAARSYFGKSASDLTLEESALLAGLVKGPNYFSPDRHPERARERLAYVMSRLREDGAISTDESAKELPTLPTLVAYERPRRSIGFYFVDQVAREAKAIAGVDAITANSYTVRSTINPQLQRTVEEALQEGLSRYERSAGRIEFRAAEANLAQAVQHIQGETKTSDKRPSWQQALASARLPLYDVHWMPAVVVEKPAGKKGGSWRVGISDGRVLPLSIDNAPAQHKLSLYDVVLVHIAEGKGKPGTRAELRARPVVQGTVVVLENRTGRVLAVTGGFSYPLSQLNRATQAQRQPGSAIKPLSYLAALGKGLQPNTLVMDKSITLPPIGGSRYWSPRNYDGSSGQTLTLRRAIENSRNLATVHLLDGGIESKPEASLSRLCDLALEAQIYRECLRYYPFVLGAQPVRPIDLAAFYASIANEGVRPAPHVVDSIERDGHTIYRQDEAPSAINSVDRAAFYQLKTMLQGVLARGTARAIAGLAPYVAGKTGTSDEENDAWFVGFSNDVTVAVWIGYDNADGKRRTLGAGATGGQVAVPIFEPVIEAVWANVAPKTSLAPPSPEAKRQLACKSVDLDSGEIQSGRGQTISECFRVDAKGKILDTQYRLIARESAHTRRDRDDSTSRDKPDRELSGSRNSSEPAYSAEYGWSGDLWRRAPQWDSRGDNIQRWGSEQRRDSVQRWDLGQRWDNAPRWRDDTRRDWQRVDPSYIWGAGVMIKSIADDIEFPPAGVREHVVETGRAFRPLAPEMPASL